MKCIHCAHDSNYKDRSGKKCPQCKRPFAFEPKDGDKLTDGAFKAAIDAVSASGKMRFGIENLYYEVARKVGQKGKVPIGCMIFTIIAAVVFFALGIWVGVIIAVVFSGLIYMVRAKRHLAISIPDFDKMYAKWCQAHGVPKGVIVRQPQPATRKKLEADIGDYSFDRAVICDRARTVDLLLANNFHFENNCAILSIDGYPQGPFETVRAMLKRNPRLQVFVLHDCTEVGCRLAHRLTHDPEWFKDHGHVVDVGLRPKQAGPFIGVWTSRTIKVDEGRGLNSFEARWLSENALELAAIRPEQTLKRLFKAVNKKFDPATTDEPVSPAFVAASAAAATSTPPPPKKKKEVDDDSGFEVDSDSFSTDASDSSGGADSFG